MGQPMGMSEGLGMANSIIAGTCHELKMIRYKERLHLTGDALHKVGTCFWRNFRKRHANMLDADTGVSQASCRKEWSTHQNFNKMYNLVYDVMDEARILEKLPEPVWMNLAGDVVDKAAAVGEKVTHHVKYPEYQVFVDEVGNNTNMKDDGNIGGEKLLKEKGNKARITAATTDQHFSVLCFTAGTGEPIMLCIIFNGHELTAEQQLGIDIQCELDPSDFTLRNNHGAGKRHPGGPKYMFRSKEVPAFICCSPKGGITSTLLMKMLERMDSLALFGGPLPFLLLDGHGSRLQLPFFR